jgi:hypothetical protein
LLIRGFLPVLVSAVMVPALAVPPGDQDQISQRVLARYFAAVSAQASKTKGIVMDMDFSAKLPRLRKEGAMLARRIVSSLGNVSFVVKSFTGDNSIKRDVIARYLSAEQTTSEQSLDSGINPKNYKFKYKRATTFNGRVAHVFELNPRMKRVGLFKGELWIDDETALPVRESGRFVRTPSIFLKQIDFVRSYSMHNGVAIPSRIESTVETRVVGKAELDIRYSNFEAEAGDQASETRAR